MKIYEVKVWDKVDLRYVKNLGLVQASSPEEAQHIADVRFIDWADYERPDDMEVEAVEECFL